MSAARKDVTKRDSSEIARSGAGTASAHKDAPNPVWFKPVMFGFMLLGLIWIVLFYITGSWPVPQLGQSNIFVGFGLMLAGFLMTPWWK